MADILFPLAY